MLREAGCSASFQVFLAPPLEQPPRAGGDRCRTPREASALAAPATAASLEPRPPGSPGWHRPLAPPPRCAVARAAPGATPLRGAAQPQHRGGAQHRLRWRMSQRGEGTAPGMRAPLCRSGPRCLNPLAPARRRAGEVQPPGDPCRLLGALLSRRGKQIPQIQAKPRWPPRALPSSCNRVRSYFGDGKAAARAPGRQSTRLPLRSTLLEGARPTAARDSEGPGDKAEQAQAPHRTPKQRLHQAPSFWPRAAARVCFGSQLVQ